MRILKLAAAFSLFANYAFAGGMPDEVIEPATKDLGNSVESTLASAADSLGQLVEFAFMALFLVL